MQIYEYSLVEAFILVGNLLSHRLAALERLRQAIS